MDPIVVIGAGAAGIMAARRAADLGSQVILLEKTARLGTKILISGGGKCNITHDGEIEDVLRPFRRNEARFIRPACYRFTNKQIVKVLTDRGLRVYTRPDGRIFPVDQTAKDVVSILRRYLDEVGVDVRFNCPVDSIECNDAEITGVAAKGNSIPCRCVVLCAGGSSYPNSGTTGDGFRMAESLGHSIVKVRAALAPIKLRGDRWTPLSGVAFRDCVLRARQNGRIVSNWRGDTLITHHGISGPCTLGISREVAEARERGGVTIEIDLVPEFGYELPPAHKTTQLQGIEFPLTATPMIPASSHSMESTGQLKRTSTPTSSR
jgi:predicted Rossmann fold flavoprotein